MDRKELEVIASALFGSAKGSQSRLAEYLGVHQTTVSRYLSGDLEIPVKVENQLAARMAGRVEVGVILDELAARQMWFSSHEGFDLFPPENLRVIIGSWESIQPAEGEQATYEHESFLDAFYFSRYRQARGDQVMVAHITMPLEFRLWKAKDARQDRQRIVHRPECKIHSRPGFCDCEAEEQIVLADYRYHQALKHLTGYVTFCVKSRTDDRAELEREGE